MLIVVVRPVVHITVTESVVTFVVIVITAGSGSSTVFFFFSLFYKYATGPFLTYERGVTAPQSHHCPPPPQLALITHWEQHEWGLGVTKKGHQILGVRIKKRLSFLFSGAMTHGFNTDWPLANLFFKRPWFSITTASWKRLQYARTAFCGLNTK